MQNLNVESLSANEICVISQLATRCKALVVLLQVTPCTHVDQLVKPLFTLAVWVSSKKHNFATFVHEILIWTLVDYSSNRSTIEWLCVGIDGCKIGNVYKPPISQLIITAITMFPYPCLYAGILNASTLTGAIITTTQWENAWLIG